MKLTLLAVLFLSGCSHTRPPLESFQFMPNVAPLVGADPRMQPIYGGTVIYHNIIFGGTQIQIWPADAEPRECWF
jgi:hypothetical protein